MVTLSEVATFIDVSRPKEQKQSIIDQSTKDFETKSKQAKSHSQKRLVKNGLLALKGVHRRMFSLDQKPKTTVQKAYRCVRRLGPF